MLGKALLSASVSAPPVVYVEDVFSTYLYTGNGSTQTITNGIDLAGEGGLVWIKRRNLGGSHNFIDTVRGQNKILFSDFDFGEFTSTPGTGLTSFTSSGFELGPSYVNFTNTSGSSLVSWTFRKAPRFFDVVTYTGNGDGNRAIPHGLGVAPGFIAVKRTDGDADWATFHRSVPSEGNSTAFQYVMQLNASNAQLHAPGVCWGDQNPDDANFYVDDLGTRLNASGATYVAYLFAHDPLGPSGDGSDGLIACGSVSGFGTVVNLGWEPQWILMKQTNGTSDWILADTMRGIPTGSQDALLFANTSGAETSANDWIDLTSTGFVNNVGSANFIYIAIRRGPMRAPTSGTEVYYYATQDATSPGHEAPVANWPVDFAIKTKTSGADIRRVATRLLGKGYLVTNATDAFASNSGYSFDYQNGFFESTAAYSDRFAWMFRRAPGFFDVVAYSGTGTGRGVPHNLGVTPEMAWIKARDFAGKAWFVHHTGLTSWAKALQLQSSGTEFNGDTGGDLPTATTFPVNTSSNVNGSGYNYIAYLFATVPGVSKVGSYTGTGTTLSIDCGFTAGARFVLIKRKDSTGDWYVWDTARGIVSGDDPYLLLNSTAAEVTNTDYIDPLSSGFQISSTAPAAINASGGTYIFLAIA
jgi:hypothetical protein